MTSARRVALLISISALLIFGMELEAYSQQLVQVSVSTEKGVYFIGEQIRLTGNVSRIVEGHQITIQIFNPNNVAYSFAQIDVMEDRTFSHEFVVGGKLGISGSYVIKVTYAGATASTQVVLEFAEKASYAVKFAGETIEVRYQINNARLTSINVDPEFLSILIFIQADDEKPGSLEIALPRELLDARKDGKESDFSVFVDGEEVPYKEIEITSAARTLLIEFPVGSADIEIVGTNVIPEFPFFSVTLAISVAVVAFIRYRGRQQTH